MKKKLLLILLMMIGGYAYSQEEDPSGRTYFGFGGGFHVNKMNYSNLDEDIYSSFKNKNSGVFSFFIQHEFGEKRAFAIRPELSIMNRGGRITDIGKYYFDNAANIKDFIYQLESKYVDLRVPLIYNFGSPNAAFRPYVFLAPVFGISTGGDIRMEEQYTNGSYFGYALDLSDANMATVYFAASAGLGVKYQFNIGKDRFFLGLDASYEYGITDTYGKKEKDGTAIVNTDYFPASYKIEGTRKFSGFEIKATLGIPFSVFIKKKAEQKFLEPEIIPAVISVPVEDKPVIVEEKPCYSLDEIINMIIRGERVEGKTICAIDAINFDFGKSSIRKDSYEYLDKLASTFIRTNIRIEVKGHTDNIGSDEFNMNLSKERAKSVVQYLMNKGVRRDKLSYSYFGMSKPLTSNDTEEGRTINRRVEFEILK